MTFGNAKITSYDDVKSWLAGEVEVNMHDAAVVPAAQTTPSGTSSMWMRAGMRSARRDPGEDGSGANHSRLRRRELHSNLSRPIVFKLVAFQSKLTFFNPIH